MACIRLSRITQAIIKDVIDGTVTITAIIVPFKTISLIVSFPVLLPLVIKEILKNGNKNQRYVVSFCSPLDFDFHENYSNFKNNIMLFVTDSRAD